ncbi:substrate-binding domain-containing protein [Flavivirga aquimarina]|uniref:Substrate-binding domain-containing protein n=1 Tax=Flavivirga aquimarina TaxID=2027862 RepID=A0ABT8WC41_9FLAO|nr:substrate-binding domain-containing protein [Flavivirga aquimarina]MDO5970723.1 substrate-binding domain-containing protein [Flavivirga aquimarina]
MITINDIAKEAGVSIGTIDRVIHNRGGVSKKTEAKVNAIIKKHDFKINVIASSLASNKKFEIATLIPEFDSKNTFWKSPMMGISKAKEDIEKFGVKVNSYTFNQFEVSSYVSQFKKIIASKPDAVIFTPLFGTETQLLAEALDNKKIPYIFLNVNLDGFDNMSFIGQDSYMSGVLAGKLMHLSINDDASIAIMQTRINVDNNHAIYNRISGFDDYFTDNNISINRTKVTIFNLDDTDELKEKLHDMFNANPTIKGIFVPSSRVFSFANCIDNSKIKDLALIGFDGTEQNIKCLEDGRVSFLISQKPFKEGYESIKLMVDYLIEKKRPVSKIYSPIEILTKENVKFSMELK